MTRSALLLLLIGTGSDVKEGTIDVPVDMRSIAGAIDEIDDETVLEILSRFMKTGGSAFSDADLSPAAETVITRILEQFKMKLKIRKR